MVKRKRLTSQSDQNEPGLPTTETTLEIQSLPVEHQIDQTGLKEVITYSPTMCGTRSRLTQPNAPAKSYESFQSTGTCTLSREMEISLPEKGASTMASAVAAGTATQRTSARVSKRNQTLEAAAAASASATSCNSPQHPPAKKTVKGVSSQPDQLRTRRSWELWSVEDKDAFFEALCEFGKDFENIQSYIAQRSKKKGIMPNMIKNKDQVRHFYYRTWHKIAKYLKFDEDVNKHTLELYGLINYAELRRKKAGCLNEKNQQKLKELVFYGETTVKFKGKKLRIKTPVCRALKRLNHLEESKEPESTKLPKEIEIELRPKSNSAFHYIQSLAQNPRVRTRVNLQRRLSSIISYLERRWLPNRLRIKNRILSSLDPNYSSASSQDKAPCLRIFLNKTTTLCTLSVASVDNACSSDVCLENFIKGSNLPLSDTIDKDSSINSKSKKLHKLKSKSCPQMQPLPFATLGAKEQGGEEHITPTYCTLEPSKELNCEGVRSDKEDGNESQSSNITSCPEAEAVRSLNLLKSMLKSTDDNDEPEDDQKSPEKEEPLPVREIQSQDQVDDSKALKDDHDDEVIDPPSINLYLKTQAKNNQMTLGQFLSLTPESNKAGSGEDFDGQSQSSPINLEEETGLVMSCTKGPDFSDKIKNGWKREDCNTLTVGELYLMLDHPEKIILEYDFEWTIADAGIEHGSFEVQQGKVQSLTQVFNHLVEMASSYFGDFKVNKQNTLSPTSVRGNPRTMNIPSVSKAPSSRIYSRSPKNNMCQVPKVSNTDSPNTSSALLTSEELDQGSCTIEDLPDSTLGGSDKHNFLMPVKTAPRPIKISPKPESIKEQLDKLVVAAQRRNQKSRNRRPVIVQRPLVPSGEGQPMTIIHLVPSTSSIPKTAHLASAGKSVQAFPLSLTNSGISGLSKDSNVQNIHHQPRGSHQPSHLLMISESNPVTMNSNIGTNAGKNYTVENSSNVEVLHNSQSSTLTSLNALPQTYLAANIKDSQSSEITLQTSSEATPNQISPSPRLLGFNTNTGLSEALGMHSSKTTSSSLDTNTSSIISHLVLNNDPLVASKQSSSPHSPGSNIGPDGLGGNFTVSPPITEGHWLNGESCDFSLSSLLNTMESPVKSIHQGPLDTMSRLGPDVDTHLQCLINENSVDYVAKFADLAAQIASTSSENKCT